MAQLQSDGYESGYFHKNIGGILLLGQQSWIWDIKFKI